MVPPVTPRTTSKLQLLTTVTLRLGASCLVPIVVGCVVHWFCLGDHLQTPSTFPAMRATSLCACAHDGQATSAITTSTASVMRISLFGLAWLMFFCVYDEYNAVRTGTFSKRQYF